MRRVRASTTGEVRYNGGHTKGDGVRLNCPDWISDYHTDKILRLSQGLPIVIEIVEDPEHIERILPKLDEMVGGGLITLEKVRVILYRSAK
ncbi:MAG TPA: DUF190 domain-containing protein [Terriglobia bacterium]|nr:DUF190 domain-containing protein [Terriglobia bacterium]